MKKGIVLVVTALLTLGSVAARAAHKNTTIEVNQEKKRVEINVEDLPVSISKELAASYAGAAVLKAYKWVDDNGDIMGYEVLLKTEAGEQTVKYGPNGEPAK